MCLRRSALTAVSALVVALVGIGGPPAGADAGAGAGASTDPAGAHVVLLRGTVWVEVGPRADAGGGSAPATGGCRRRWVPAAAAVYLRTSRVASDIHTVPMPPRPTPAHEPYHVYCDGDYVTSVWLLPDQFLGTPAVDPRALAERLARDLPYPAATIGANPSGRGLTGLESWFWVSGYSGAPIADAVQGFGLLVEVEAAPAVVTWSFGDGSAAGRGTLGRANTAEVRHVFDRPGRSITVRASVRLDVRWRVNGGPWEPLGPVVRSATRAYPVAESRAALVPPASG